MSRPVIIVLLLIIVAGGGWYIYDQNTSDGVQIEFDDDGISIDEN